MLSDKKYSFKLIIYAGWQNIKIYLYRCILTPGWKIMENDTCQHCQIGFYQIKQPPGGSAMLHLNVNTKCTTKITHTGITYNKCSYIFTKNHIQKIHTKLFTRCK